MLKTPKIFVRLLLIGSLSAVLLACQSSSQSSSNSGTPAPPSPSTSSPSSSSSSSGSASSQQSSSSSQSQGSRSSQSSQNSQSNRSPNSQSPSGNSGASSNGAMPSIPGGTQGQQQGSGSPSSAPNSADQSGGSSSILGNGQRSGQGPLPGPRAGSQQGNSSQGSNGGNLGDSPAQNAGTQPRFPVDQQSGGIGNRDSSSNDLESGDTVSLGSNLPGPSGDYSLDTLPSGVLSGSRAGNTDQETGAMTATERAAILDERLRKGYETFDGFILSERERAQNESNAAGSVAVGGASGGGASSGAGNPGDQPQTLEDAAISAGVLQSMPNSASGAPSLPPPENFPLPEDIPGGRDDDVVARQLREAAMSEPDPVLREALWDEYRNYTGIGEDQ